MSFVVDASITLAWCFEAEQNPAVIGLLDRATGAGAVAPQIWPIETLNGLLMAERRGRIDAARRHALAGFLEDLPIAVDQETVSRLWRTTSRIAETHRLTAYDATYLELALRLGLPLATRDRALSAAAMQAGAAVLPTA